MMYYYQNRPFLFSPDSPVVQEKSNDPNWDAEIKKNGTRLKLMKVDNKFLFYNRRKEILKYTPCPELLDELNSLELPNETDLDGELMHAKTKHIKHFIFFYDIYFLNGVKVNKEIVMTSKERLDCKLILIEKNVEVRKEIIKKIGINRVIKDLGAKTIEKNDIYIT